MRGWTLGVVVLAAGCVHVSSSVLDHGYATDPYREHEVDVFLVTDVPPDDCDRVAILHASGSNNASETKIIDKLREEAGAHGANAIHILSAEDAGAAERVVAEVFGAVSDKDWDALALYCPSLE